MLEGRGIGVMGKGGFRMTGVGAVGIRAGRSLRIRGRPMGQGKIFNWDGVERLPPDERYPGDERQRWWMGRICS